MIRDAPQTLKTDRRYFFQDLEIYELPEHEQIITHFKLLPQEVSTPKEKLNACVLVTLTGSVRESNHLPQAYIWVESLTDQQMQFNCMRVISQEYEMTKPSFNYFDV